MQIFQTYSELPESAQDAVIAIGNFDGVHLGHQALLKKALSIAHEHNCPLGVLTFEPHPSQLFRPDEPPRRITPAALKADRLQHHKVDFLFSLPFDWNFASQSAEDFVKNILIDGLKAKHIVVGNDFRFGQLRKGTTQTIIDAGLEVSVIDKVAGDDNQDFSSSKIRQLLRHGDIEEANNILGWNWEIQGTIIEGDKRGRELGYPTANMNLEDTIHPAYGIYACMVKLKDEDTWKKGAANIGIRPMFEVPVAQVETYIFDFDREIYGETLSVRPVKKLRGEAKFDTLDALIKQMSLDCEQAKEVLEKIA